MILLVFVCAYLLSVGADCQCVRSLTTVVGSQAPSKICSGQLIFEDNFNHIDKSKWKFENTLAGGGNWEFQWYPGNDPNNAFTSNGNLHIAPTTTASVFGENFLSTQKVKIPASECTQADWYGCERQGTKDYIINPVRSTKIDTRDSFAFKYGVMKIRAKLPAGDWLWPALWLLPKKNVYGGWPRSGEIDLMESRGNRNYYQGNRHLGVEQVSSTLHFGPRYDFNGFMTAHGEKFSRPGFNEDFHVYTLEWTPWKIKFSVDNDVIATIDAGNGFWARASLWNSGMTNPWANASKMAPFDQEFYIIMNLAVGGTNGFFPDDAENRPRKKPWKNSSGRAAADFWEKKNDWLPTWNLRVNDDSHFQIDYVRVWAL